MRCAARVWATFVLFVVTSGCERTDEEAPVGGAAVEEEAPLDVDVEGVDVVHGALRLRGAIAAGATDLAISLSDDGEHRALGGGFATRLAFTWMLDEAELGAAIEHGLVVRARTWDGDRYARASASLAVTAALTQITDPAPDARDTPEQAPDVEIGSAIAYRDFARAILMRRTLAVGTSTFDPSVAINDVGLAGEETADDDAEEQGAEDPSEEGPQR